MPNLKNYSGNMARNKLIIEEHHQVLIRFLHPPKNCERNFLPRGETLQRAEHGQSLKMYKKPFRDRQFQLQREKHKVWRMMDKRVFEPTEKKKTRSDALSVLLMQLLE